MCSEWLFGIGDIRPRTITLPGGLSWDKACLPSVGHIHATHGSSDKAKRDLVRARSPPDNRMGQFVSFFLPNRRDPIPGIPISCSDKVDGPVDGNNQALVTHSPITLLIPITSFDFSLVYSFLRSNGIPYGFVSLPSS